MHAHTRTSLRKGDVLCAVRVHLLWRAQRAQHVQMMCSADVQREFPSLGRHLLGFTANPVHISTTRRLISSSSRPKGPREAECDRTQALAVQTGQSWRWPSCRCAQQTQRSTISPNRNSTCSKTFSSRTVLVSSSSPNLAATSQLLPSSQTAARKSPVFAALLWP
jgi:hypothetical protein